MSITLDDLRAFAVTRSLFTPTTLKRALRKFGFVQADPIRAPARAQDLILRHRVKDYCAGDLERRYAQLGIAEDFFINYGFVTEAVQALMHPRWKRKPAAHAGAPRAPWFRARRTRAHLLLEFVRERGVVHPREVDAHFAHGSVTNYWGGSSNATTHLLDAMHYQGLLRVARREAGIRLYAAHEHGPVVSEAAERRARIDALLDVAVRIYAPLPMASLRTMVRRLHYAVPHWQGELTAAVARAKQRLGHTQVDGVDWYWPAEEKATRGKLDDRVRLLTPFDPIVWDRKRFELLWGWEYRFEAYTPVAKRKRGYYALPLLWRDRVIGWANVSVKNGELHSEFGYVQSEPKDLVFKRELDAELEQMKVFLGLTKQH